MPDEVFYKPENVQGVDYHHDLGDPGEFPFTRGIHPEMYSRKLWTMRQYAGYGSARETNERFRLLLKSGQTGLSTAFDLPTQMGYDPDDPKALGEVGKVGVSISSLKDMELLFQGIPLDQVSTSMTINATAGILLAFYTALGEKQGVSPQKLAGTFQNDILKEFIARGTYIYPVPFSLKLTIDIMEHCLKFSPKINPISISGYHIREAGSTAEQEVAFTFANAIAYLAEAQKRGISLEELGTKISFFFACHNHFLEEIAKFRAARKVWAHIMKDKFKVKNPKAMLLRFHTQTSGATLTSQQPLNNLVRVALQALAAVLGGTQSLHTNSYDEAIALPTEESARLALRTQQILAYETGITQTADPLGGSYYLESLTKEMEEKIHHILKEIESRGGALECLSSHYFEQEIQQSAYHYQKSCEEKKDIIVGVNAFQIQEDNPPPILRISPEIEKEAVERIAKLKKERSQTQVKESLAEIKKAALSEENLIPSFITAVKSSVTLGEISYLLRELFGEYDLLF
ncbi:MAG: methylmalonyl-CoA mutase family protein [Firmicutes bacterium]|nr:methylmalonyl-CoA mutase family protein [Bacillota bacterium]